MIPVLALAIGLGAASLADTDHAAALSSEFSTSENLWIDRTTLLALPMSGAAWEHLVADATSDWGSPEISNQDSNHDVRTLAGALYAVRTNDTAMRDKTVAAIEGAIGTEAGGRTLALARNLTGYVLAADIVGYESARFTDWLRQVRFADLDGRTLVSTHEDRPNNWGTHAGAARVAADRYLGDADDLSKAVAVFRGFLGDHNSYAGFKFGDPEWQADDALPSPINPLGSTKRGYVVDGAIVDDIRRCECSVTSPAPRENYQWEGMQGIVTQAELLRRAGHHDIWSWSDAAIRRAVEFLDVQADFPAEGDDSFLPFLIDANLGTAYSIGAQHRTGKSVGYTGWTHGTTSVADSTTSTTPTSTTEASSTTTSTSSTTTTTGTTATTTTTAMPTTTTGTTATTVAPTTTTGTTATTVAPTTETVEPPPASSSRALSSTLVAGVETGTYQDTWARGGGSHTVIEEEVGESARRHDQGELRWTIAAATGEQVLDVVMTVSPDAGDADAGFLVEWSENGMDWTPIALVASGTTLDLVVDIGAPTSDVYVRVVDSARSKGEQRPDWTSIDFLRVRTAPDRDYG